MDANSVFGKAGSACPGFFFHVILFSFWQSLVLFEQFWEFFSVGRSWNMTVTVGLYPPDEEIFPLHSSFLLTLDFSVINRAVTSFLTAVRSAPPKVPFSLF